MEKYKPTEKEDQVMSTKLAIQLQKTNKVLIGKTSEFVPKADLTYEEFMAIKSDYSSYEFSPTFKAFESIIWSQFGIWTLGKFLKVIKKI